MYVLYISTLSFILYALYNCFSKKNRKNVTVKKLDSEKNYLFLIKNIEYYKNGKCIEYKIYNNYYFRQNNIELNVNFLYDFFVVNYTYDNTDYKYYSENSFLKFPMYSSEQIRNYVYINKISSAKLFITETDKNEISSTNEIDVLHMLIPFVGPNYNFYKDLEVFDIKFNVDKILTYLKYKNDYKFDKLNELDKLDTLNKNYKLLLYDNFNNEYNLDSNDLIWNPELKL